MRSGRLILGIALIAIGGLFLLDQADVIDAGETIREWWPAALIVLGLVQLIERPRHYLVPLLLVGLGAIFLLVSTEIVKDVSVGGLVGPTLLIAVGLAVLFGRSGMAPPGRDDRVTSVVVFFGRELASASQRFRGGMLFTVFGGTELDLRSAALDPSGATLDVVNVFGGTNILVPHGWRVSVKGLPVFGGWSNKTSREPLPEDAPVLSIDALVAFGGLEVSHGKS